MRTLTLIGLLCFAGCTGTSGKEQLLYVECPSLPSGELSEAEKARRLKLLEQQMEQSKSKLAPSQP